jgi:1-acyl-sn-glycerol-3-phosphate acyltransferase
VAKVLGDNPFDPKAKPNGKKTGETAQAVKPKAKAKPKARARAKAPVEDEAVAKSQPLVPEPDSDYTPLPPPVDEFPVDDDGDEAEATPDTVPPDETWGDVFYGEEAAPPPGDYGPGLDQRREIPYTRKSATEEVRELERRVRAQLTPAFPIEHRRKVPFEFLWRRYRDLAMRDRSDVVDEFGRDPMVASRVKPMLDFLYRKYFRVEVSGVEHIPDTGRGLLVANHSGTLPYDGALLMHAVRTDSPAHREVRPLVEDFVFHFPYLGTFINRIGGVRACQENAERLLAQDQLVAVFPEGIKGVGKLYKERYRLQRFGRGGFIKLALRMGAPIIPVAIVGAEEIHPMVAKVTWLAKSIGVPYIPVTPTFPLLGPLGLLPLPSKWHMKIGAPIDYAQRYGPSAVHDRILVNKLAESVRSSIQDMIDELLSQRKSVLFG